MKSQKIQKIVFGAVFGAMAVAGAATAHAQYAGPSGVTQTTVKELVANGRDDQHVILQGRIVRHLGGEDYEFADATGQMRVEIDDKLWAGQPVIDEKRQVKLTGEFERKLVGPERVDVERLEVIR